MGPQGSSGLEGGNTLKKSRTTSPTKEDPTTVTQQNDGKSVVPQVSYGLEGGGDLICFIIPSLSPNKIKPQIFYGRMKKNGPSGQLWPRRGGTPWKKNPKQPLLPRRIIPQRLRTIIGKVWANRVAKYWKGGTSSFDLAYNPLSPKSIKPHGSKGKMGNTLDLRAATD